TLKAIVTDMDGKELLKIEETSAGEIQKPEVVEHLTTSHLDKLSKEGLNPTVKKAIGKIVNDWGTNTKNPKSGQPHKCKVWINKKDNKPEWI
ncbi:MAG: hypothetical protein M3Q80_02370, partial [bacterium]|nr:hypothetical protein [bacterium]